MQHALFNDNLKSGTLSVIAIAYQTASHKINVTFYNWQSKTGTFYSEILTGIASYKHTKYPLLIFSSDSHSGIGYLKTYLNTIAMLFYKLNLKTDLSLFCVFDRIIQKIDQNFPDLSYITG